MAINKRNTGLLKERFKEEFELNPVVLEEDEHGCAYIYVEIEDAVNFQELNRLVEGIGNTLTIRAVGPDKLRIKVW